MVLLVASVVADGDDHAREHDAIREALQRGEVLPLVRILAIAQEKVPGDVIEVELGRATCGLSTRSKCSLDRPRARSKIDARSGAV